MEYFRNDEETEPSPLDIEQLRNMNIEPFHNGKNPVLYALRGFVKENPECKIPYKELEIKLLDYFSDNDEIPSKHVFGKQLKRAMKVLKKEGVYTKITSPRIEGGMQQRQLWISKNPFAETTKGGAGPWLIHKKKRGKYKIKVLPEVKPDQHQAEKPSSMSSLVKSILETRTSNDIKVKLLCALIDS